MGVYNNNKDGTRSTLANTIQVVDAPIEQFVSRGEFNAVVPSDTSADNKLVNNNTVDTKLNDIWKVQGKLGAKNLLARPYHHLSPKTTNGVTFVVNDDGSLTCNGIATGYASYDFHARNTKFILEQGTYVFYCNDAFPNDAYLGLWYKESEAITGVTLATLNNANKRREFTITSEIVENIKSGAGYLLIRIVFNEGTTVDNTTVHPMICIASDTDDTWQPYAPTNYQLNQKINMTAGVYLPNAANTNSKKIVASVGQTSVTFDANSFMTRYNVTSADLDLDISAETASGDVVAYNNVSVTGGIVTVTFDALAEQTTFICKCSVIQ